MCSAESIEDRWVTRLTPDLVRSLTSRTSTQQSALPCENVLWGNDSKLASCYVQPEKTALWGTVPARMKRSLVLES